MDDQPSTYRTAIIEETPSKQEMVKLEQALATAEIRYAQDISKLQHALLRSKKLQNLSLISLQLRLYPAIKQMFRLAKECAFYKWKCQIRPSSTFQLVKALRTMSHYAKMRMIQAFIIYREKSNQMHQETSYNPPISQSGAITPIMLDENSEMYQITI